MSTNMYGLNVIKILCLIQVFSLSSQTSDSDLQFQIQKFCFFASSELIYENVMQQVAASATCEGGGKLLDNKVSLGGVQGLVEDYDSIWGAVYLVDETDYQSILKYAQSRSQLSFMSQTRVALQRSQKPSICRTIDIGIISSAFPFSSQNAATFESSIAQYVERLRQLGASEKYLRKMNTAQKWMPINFGNISPISSPQNSMKRRITTKTMNQRNSKTLRSSPLSTTNNMNVFEEDEPELTIPASSSVPVKQNIKVQTVKEHDGSVTKVVTQKEGSGTTTLISNNKPANYNPTLKENTPELMKYDGEGPTLLKKAGPTLNNQKPIPLRHVQTEILDTHNLENPQPLSTETSQNPQKPEDSNIFEITQPLREPTLPRTTSKGDPKLPELMYNPEPENKLTNDNQRISQQMLPKFTPHENTSESSEEKLEAVNDSSPVRPYTMPLRRTPQQFSNPGGRSDMSPALQKESQSSPKPIPFHNTPTQITDEEESNAEKCSQIPFKPEDNLPKSPQPLRKPMSFQNTPIEMLERKGNIPENLKPTQCSRIPSQPDDNLPMPFQNTPIETLERKGDNPKNLKPTQCSRIPSQPEDNLPETLQPVLETMPFQNTPTEISENETGKLKNLKPSLRNQIPWQPEDSLPETSQALNELAPFQNTPLDILERDSANPKNLNPLQYSQISSKQETNLPKTPEPQHKSTELQNTPIEMLKKETGDPKNLNPSECSRMPESIHPQHEQSPLENSMGEKLVDENPSRLLPSENGSIQKSSNDSPTLENTLLTQELDDDSRVLRPQKLKSVSSEYVPKLSEENLDNQVFAKNELTQLSNSTPMQKKPREFYKSDNTITIADVTPLQKIMQLKSMPPKDTEFENIESSTLSNNKQAEPLTITDGLPTPILQQLEPKVEKVAHKIDKTVMDVLTTPKTNSLSGTPRQQTTTVISKDGNRPTILVNGHPVVSSDLNLPASNLLSSTHLETQDPKPIPSLPDILHDRPMNLQQESLEKNTRPSSNDAIPNLRQPLLKEFPTSELPTSTTHLKLPKNQESTESTKKSTDDAVQYPPTGKFSQNQFRSYSDSNQMTTSNVITTSSSNSPNVQRRQIPGNQTGMSKKEKFTQLESDYSDQNKFSLQSPSENTPIPGYTIGPMVPEFDVLNRVKTPSFLEKNAVPSENKVKSIASVGTRNPCLLAAPKQITSTSTPIFDANPSRVTATPISAPKTKGINVQVENTNGVASTTHIASTNGDGSNTHSTMLILSSNGPKAGEIQTAGTPENNAASTRAISVTN